MPQGETYWNPYRLIPVRGNVDRKAVWTDERFRGHSGIIECTLENLTLLFIGSSVKIGHPPLILPLLRNKRRIISGSSLKGMLRSLAEIVGGGCFIVHNDRGSDKIPRSPIPTGMAACDNVDRLCIACRMFGAMERRAPARVHKGKVSIGDAIVREESLNHEVFRVLLANNGVRHEPFYRSQSSGQLDGKNRKLYFHQPKRKQSVPEIPQNLLKSKSVSSIDALFPGHHFNFEVQFTSLDNEELALLLYVLHLEKQVQVVIGDAKIELQGPMRHKIGNAKPLGMGSSHITINRMTILAEPKDRFSTMQTGKDQVWEKQALESEIQKRINSFVNDKSPTMTALRKMMVWDEKDPRDFHYPDYNWFQSTPNKPKPLKPL